MKNRHILIIAANAREGAKYAKNSDLPNFTYRVVRAAGSITGVRSVDVHLVDGFDKRPDAGAILARLRWAPDIAYYSTSMPPEPVKDEGDGMGEQLTLLPPDLQPSADYAREFRRHKSVDPVIEIVGDPRGPLTLEQYAMAYDEHAHRGHDAPTPSPEEQERVATILERIKPVAGETSNGDAMVSEGAPTAKRRKRCKVCGRLTTASFEEDPEGHDEDAHKPPKLFS